MEAEQPLDEKILRRIPAEIILLTFMMALGVWILFDVITAAFVLLGGILAAVGFIWLRQSVTKFLFSGKKKALRTGILIYSLRLVLIIAIFFIIILFFSKEIFALVAGFSTIILVFLVEAIIALSSLKQWKS
jgi:hypothetical protein